jgi:beta-N-acetylglucosaminidase/RNase P/RNase MRP subunit p29
MGFIVSFLPFGLTAKADNPVYAPPVGQAVHYNWGSGGPAGFPVDNFNGLFNQSGTYSAGDYFVQTFADDGVKVEADGKWVINRWSGYTAKEDRGLWLGVTEGQHEVKTHYYEGIGSAGVYSDIVPLDNWLAYYYPNTTLSGFPTAAKVIEPLGESKKLADNHGFDGPVTGFRKDQFSAKYTTAKRLSAGEYILRAKADDGFRVYVDGKLVLDRWKQPDFNENMVKIQVSDQTGVPTNEKDIHWVEVQYYDAANEGFMELSIEPLKAAASSGWVEEYFPNMTLQGTPSIKISNSPFVSYNWGNGSPMRNIPSDGFSARLTREVDFEEGLFRFQAKANDGVRVWVDDQLVLDGWVRMDDVLLNKVVPLTKGSHTIKIEAYEISGLANLSFSYSPLSKMQEQRMRSVGFNWGSGSPSGQPSDYFMGIFNQSGVYSAGDYFVQTFADDGVKVEADGKWLVNRWSGYTAKEDRGLWLGVTEGQHEVKTHYYEGVGGAGVYSHIVPLDSWLAYYYPNTTLTGLPTASKVVDPVGVSKKLSENFGLNGPIAGYQKDQFSAKYTTAKRLEAGEYILRAKADDGFRVFVDGKLVLDRWRQSNFNENAVKLQIADQTGVSTTEKNIHWVEVQYFDAANEGLVEVSLEPFKTAISNTWVEEYYSNMSLQGTPFIKTTAAQSINYNWGNGSPHSNIPSDGFSARLTREVTLEEGLYRFEAKANDGVRVWVDDQLILDGWVRMDGVLLNKVIPLSKGKHTIKVEQFEISGEANLYVNYSPLTKWPLQTLRDVQFNWGSGSPAGIPADYFTATFNQGGSFPAGDYFVQTFADDGVKVEADGKALINRMSGYTAKEDRALWLGVTEGAHQVTTQYYEGVGGAGIYSHILPLDTWLAYYYPNTSLAGFPTAAKVIQPNGSLKKLSEAHGIDGPVAGFQKDQFSAKYTTAKRLPAGEYIIRAKGDDGYRVYVDGKLVLDRWKQPNFSENAVKIRIDDQTGSSLAEKNIHWVEVQYFDAANEANIELSVEPFITEIDNTWVAEYYPNISLEGTPIVIGGKNSALPITTLNYNWGSGSPHYTIPTDGFSGRFTKQVQLEEGTYLFNVKSDNGVRVYLDNKLVVDRWGNSTYSQEEGVFVNSGSYKIVVEYFDSVGVASLSFDLSLLSKEKLFYQAIPQVNYNWGVGGPVGFPVDNFKSMFNQSQTFAAGDYFVQTFADDGIKVEANGQTLINRYTGYTGKEDRALWLGVTAGHHTIQTTHYEGVGEAGIHSNIVPFDTWLAYYYPNTSLSGFPGAAKIIQPVGTSKKLVENHGTGAPAAGFQTDQFSAKYTTAKRIGAGEYVLRASADDGVRVYIDGNLVLNRWTAGNGQEDAVKVTIQDRNVTNAAEKNVHWIEVHYQEGYGTSSIDFALQPISEVLNTDQWVGYFFPNKELSGNPVIFGGTGAKTPLTVVDFNWDTDKPHSLLPADGFSARFVKKAYFTSGIYQINTVSDDGIRIYVDGVLQAESWVDSVADVLDTTITLGTGIHEIMVEYYESSGPASVKIDIKNLTEQNARFISAVRLPAYRSFNELADYTIHHTYYNPGYTRYFELNYGDIVYILEHNKYGARIRTSDGRDGWVQREYLENNLTDDWWLVKESRTLRAAATTASSNIGYIPNNSRVKVLNHTITSGSLYTEWYYIQLENGQKGWIWGAGNPGDNQGFNIIKYEFEKAGAVTNQINMFTPLNSKANVTADQINRFIASKTNGQVTAMTNMGYAYLVAQERSGLNAIYLMAHSASETGWGTSSIVKMKNNFYGIGAIDSAPMDGAYGFTTAEGGIIAGAAWIRDNYVIRANDTDTRFPFTAQPTLDNMLRDNSWHEYAEDEAWAAKISQIAQDFYLFIGK